MSENELTVRLGNEGKLNALPAVVWNEAEVAERLSQMLEAYQGRQYTAQDIKGAKADRAAVNKIEKQLAEAQKAVTDLYKQPVAEFVEKMRYYRTKTKEVSSAIDAQVKAVEQAAKAEKRALLQAVYDAHIGDELRPLIAFEALEDPRWLNASTAQSTAEKELLLRIETCRREREDLRQMCDPADFAAVDQAYLEHLSIREAMSAHRKLLDVRAAQEQAEQARRQAKAARAAAPVILRPTQQERDIRTEAAQRAEDHRIITEEGRLDFSQMDLQQFAAEEEPQPYDFRAWLTQADIIALKEFFASRNIRYGKAQ